jgi:hypothetical protein
MDFEPEPEHIVCYNEPMFAYDFKIYSRYKNKSYVSHCIKLIMIDGSSVIKNALEAENSDCFYVPSDIEIEPNAFKSILAYLHIKKLSPHYEIGTKDEKNIQNILLISNWFGFTSYKDLIDRYISLLKRSDRTLNMFTQIDHIHNFLDLSEQNINSHNNDSMISCDVSRDVSRDKSLTISNEIIYNTKQIIQPYNYNPIFGLITGDKLNDSYLIDASLSLFDFKAYIEGVFEPFEKICALLDDHLMRETTKEKLYLIFNGKREIYTKFEPRKASYSFSEGYKIQHMDWKEFVGEQLETDPVSILERYMSMRADLSKC